MFASATRGGMVGGGSVGGKANADEEGESDGPRIGVGIAFKLAYVSTSALLACTPLVSAGATRWSVCCFRFVC